MNSVDSPLGQFSFRASANVFPRQTGRLTSRHPAGPALDFCRPGSFNFGEILCFGVIQTGEQLCGDIGTFGDRQRQGFPKKFLRP